MIIEITPRIIRPDVSYSDAANFTSDGYQITGPGSTTNLKEIEPDIYDIEKIDNMQNDIREFENRVVTPNNDK